MIWEELKNRKINKIEFKNPGYYVAKYGEKMILK